MGVGGAVDDFLEHRAEMLGTEDAQGQPELQRVEAAGGLDALVDRFGVPSRVWLRGLR